MKKKSPPRKVVALEKRDWQRVVANLQHKPLLAQKITTALEQVTSAKRYGLIRIALTERQHKFFQNAASKIWNTGTKSP